MTRYNKPFFDSSGDNTAQTIKTSQGELKYLHIINSNTDEAYLQLFDALAANVTVGTTTPVQSYLIPAGSASEPGAFETTFGDNGLYFDKGIVYACSTGVATNGNPSAGLTVNAVYD